MSAQKGPKAVWIVPGTDDSSSTLKCKPNRICFDVPSPSTVVDANVFHLNLHLARCGLLLSLSLSIASCSVLNAFCRLLTFFFGFVSLLLHPAPPVATSATETATSTKGNGDLYLSVIVTEDSVTYTFFFSSFFHLSL